MDTGQFEHYIDIVCSIFYYCAALLVHMFHTLYDGDNNDDGKASVCVMFTVAAVSLLLTSCLNLHRAIEL